MSSEYVTNIRVESEMARSARAVQISSMMDVPDESLVREWRHELPIAEQPWNVGLIVGASGAGKTILANQLWPDQMSTQPEWSRDKTVVDSFPPDMSIKAIMDDLTSVGLASVPTWLRPHHQLSNGEQFRANIAYQLATTTPGQPTVVDEFTSVVDRQVGKIVSHSVQKRVRRDNTQFVAVSCHRDILDWLQPDWVYDVETSRFVWRSVQPRPRLTIDIHAATRADWLLFAPHHYLSKFLHGEAVCYVAWIDGAPVAFTSYRRFPHAKARNIKMGHRLVVLPDYQGLGIGGVLDNWLGEKLASEGMRYRNVVAHPVMIRFYSQSPRWRDTRKHSKRSFHSGPNANKSLAKDSVKTRVLSQRSFEYQPAEPA